MAPEISRLGDVTRADLIDRILSDGEGSTGETCRGLIKYLDNHRLPITIFEQSDEMMSKKNRAQYEWFVNTLGELGFACHAAVFDSSKYNVPSSRLRTYGCIVEFKEMGLSHRQADLLARTVIDDAVKMRRDSKPRKLTEYLCAPSDPKIVEELKLLKDTKAKDLEKGIDDFWWMGPNRTDAMTRTVHVGFG